VDGLFTIGANATPTFTGFVVSMVVITTATGATPTAAAVVSLRLLSFDVTSFNAAAAAAAAIASEVVITVSDILGSIMLKFPLFLHTFEKRDCLIDIG